MDLDEFRRVHSELVEHYQFIEHHLEGIYSALQDKYFYDGLVEVEKDNIPRLIHRILSIQQKNGEVVLSEEDLSRINNAYERRNFWCHNCYVDLVFDRKTGGPSHLNDVKAMMSDLVEAKSLRDELFERKLSYMERKRKNSKDGVYW